jgi:predicted nucleotidyltransferase
VTYGRCAAILGQDDRKRKPRPGRALVLGVCAFASAPGRVSYAWAVSGSRGSAPRLSRRRSIQRIVQALQSYGAERIYLFGSTARGEADALSDLDLVIIKATDRPFLDPLRDVAALLPADVGGVDIFVYSPDEFRTMVAQGNAFAEMVLEEGHLVHDRQAKG